MDEVERRTSLSRGVAFHTRKTIVGRDQPAVFVIRKVMVKRACNTSRCVMFNKVGGVIDLHNIETMTR